MATPTEEERLRRWQPVLGKESQTIPGRAGMDDGLAGKLDSDDAQMDTVLEALYDSDRSGGAGQLVSQRQSVAGRYSHVLPSFACTPDLFPELMATAIRKGNIAAWAVRHEIITR